VVNFFAKAAVVISKDMLRSELENSGLGGLGATQAGQIHANHFLDSLVFQH
jgi:hypothetical protein